MKKILAIGIPTYKRAKLVENLVRVLGEKIRPFQDEVSLIVSNNCSPDDTEERLLKLQKKFPFHYNKNPQNVGGERNIIRCFELSDAEFTWTMGDDDDMSQLNLGEILAALKSATPDMNLFHFDCSIINGRDNSVRTKSFYQAELPRTLTTVEFAKMVGGKSTSVLMWLGANIVRTQTLHEARKRWEDVSVPPINLFWYAYCALSSPRIHVFDASHVSMICDTSCWADEYGSRLPVFDLPLIRKRLLEQPGLSHVDETFASELRLIARQPLFSRLWFEVLLARHPRGFGDLKKAMQNKIISRAQVCLIFLFGPPAWLLRRVILARRS